MQGPSGLTLHHLAGKVSCRRCDRRYSTFHFKVEITFRYEFVVCRKLFAWWDSILKSLYFHVCQAGTFEKARSVKFGCGGFNFRFCIAVMSSFSIVLTFQTCFASFLMVFRFGA